MRIKLLMLSLLCLTTIQMGGSKKAQSQMDPITAIANVAPALAPVVQDVFHTYLDIGKSAVKKLTSKKLRCNFCNKGFTCKIRPSFSMCKSMCQEVQQIGGYELRIRFGGEGSTGSINVDDTDSNTDTQVSENWSIADCVRKGVQRGIQTSAGRGNTKSIAIYSMSDLRYLLKLLSYIEAAELQIASRGKGLLDEDGKQLTGDALDRELSRVKEIPQQINNIIRQQVSDGRFGNQ